MPGPERIRRPKLKIKALQMGGLCLLWFAVSAALLFSFGQGWRALAVVSLPILGLFGTSLLALYFGPFAKETREAPSNEGPQEPTT
ncbi:hypothetical protein ACFYOC_04890 [Nocardiopsis alba]|uniref:hypothetical protein n=1 Tax=Nocardiopsis alba TaxID=53437 RepID=UPI000A897389|nr:hypothetical protein [Nocardiopsis alba]